MHKVHCVITIEYCTGFDSFEMPFILKSSGTTLSLRSPTRPPPFRLPFAYSTEHRVHRTKMMLGACRHAIRNKQLIFSCLFTIRQTMKAIRNFAYYTKSCPTYYLSMILKALYYYLIEFQSLRQSASFGIHFGFRGKKSQKNERKSAPFVQFLESRQFCSSRT